MGGFFFFDKTRGFIRDNYANLYTSSTRAAKASRGSALAEYGWKASIVDAAGKMSELENVRRSNLYEFMDFISIKRAEIEFQQRINEQAK